MSKWLMGWITPAEYWRRHGNRDTMKTGEVLIAPGRNHWRRIGPITVDTGKGLKVSRMTEWPVGAKKSGNADGAKGPC